MPPEPAGPVVTVLPEIYEGGQTIPSEITPDGKVMVGSCVLPTVESGQPAQAQAFRWSEKDGFVPMGFLPEKPLSFGVATNHDGSIIVGYGANPDDDTVQAWIWTATKGMQPIPPPRDGAQTEAYDVTDDGTVFGRYAYVREDGLIWQGPFLWSEERGYGDFPLEAWGGTTDAAWMDPASIALDGLSLVFDRNYPDPNAEIPLGAWVAEFGLPFGEGAWIQYALEQQDGPQFFPSPRAYISNPRMLAGSSTHIDLGMPMSVPAIWTPATGIQILFDGAPGQAWCISPDGTLVGGGNLDAGTAFMWDARSGFQNLMLYAQQMDYLLGTDLYDQFVEAGHPSNVLGIALGNKRLVGTVGSSAFGNPCRAFVLDLP